MENSINSVKTVRKIERARKEAEFQRAVANGLSYEEQARMREKQLQEERDSSFSDPTYIQELESSIATTNKLNRFHKYRTKYATTLAELSAGRINEERYLLTLKDQLGGINDPELRLEVQGDITAGEEKLKSYRDTVLSNQVKKAKYDGTKGALDEAIAKVQAARAEALISDSQDEVTAYDETLSALRSQSATVRVQDSITDFQVKSTTRGVNPVEKLNLISNEIAKSDPNTPVRIGDRTYASVQQFWSLERDSFLGGNSDIFGNFFKELNDDAAGKIAVNASRFGYPTQAALDEVAQTFNELKQKPEFAPYTSRLDIVQASVMTDAADKLANAVIDVGTNNLTFKDADAQLLNIASRYGVNMDAYRLKLDQQLRGLAAGGIIDTDEATDIAPDVNLELPTVGGKTKPQSTPSTPATPAPAGGTPNVGSVREVRTGDTLSGIAQEAGVPLAQLLELNPQYKANPNLVRVGEKVNLPKPATTPAPAPAQTPAPAIHQGATQQATPPSAVSIVPPTPPATMTAPPPVTAPASVPTPVVSTPTPPPAAPAPAQKKTYNNLYEYYTNTIGSYPAWNSTQRMADAKKAGITGYVGDEKQNVALLSYLQSQ